MTTTSIIPAALALAASLLILPGAVRADERATALPSRTAAAPAYVCDLRTTANQCRQLRPVAATDTGLQTMSEGCASMGGTFRAQTSCPRERRIARCTDIAPDPNHLDRLTYTYDAHYYAEGAGGWTPASVRRVCINLMGAYIVD